MRAWQRLRQVLVSQACFTHGQGGQCTPVLELQTRCLSQLPSLTSCWVEQQHSSKLWYSHDLAKGHSRHFCASRECMRRSPGSIGGVRDDDDAVSEPYDADEIDLSSLDESSEESDSEEDGRVRLTQRQRPAEEVGLDHPLLREFDTTTKAKQKFTLGRILDGKEDVFGPPRFKQADMEAADAESEYLSFFKTKVVDVNRTSRGSKTGGIGRFSALVVVGNSNGVLGLGMGKSTELPAAVQKANNQAMKTLFFVPRYRSATILHPVTGHYGKCKVIMYPRSTGSGCKASHMISSICNLAGIQDIGVKVHGTRNLRNTVKALIRCFEAQTIPEEQALLSTNKTQKQAVQALA